MMFVLLWGLLLRMEGGRGFERDMGLEHGFCMGGVLGV